MLVGGLKRERQTFDRTAANTQSLMLLLACVALIMPAIFELVIGGSLPNPTRPSSSRRTSRRCPSAWRSSSWGPTSPA